MEKVWITPIALWQRLSYNVFFIQCQFYPSCSNYAAHTISEHGFLLGIPLIADRIVRCNPVAYDYHLRDWNEDLLESAIFHSDGRLMDPVPTSPFTGLLTRNKSPILAGVMSAVLPGAGRIYAGRFWDGFFGFFTVALAINAARISYQHQSKLGMAFYGVMSVAFYAGEILGAYRAASR